VVSSAGRRTGTRKVDAAKMSRSIKLLVFASLLTGTLEIKGDSVRPDLALWNSIKRALYRDGDAYFNSSFKVHSCLAAQTAYGCSRQRCGLRRLL
jgi:hypothetical protein